jgi:hypothetical protein
VVIVVVVAFLTVLTYLFALLVLAMFPAGESQGDQQEQRHE